MWHLSFPFCFISKVCPCMCKVSKKKHRCNNELLRDRMNGLILHSGHLFWLDKTSWTHNDKQTHAAQAKSCGWHNCQLAASAVGPPLYYYCSSNCICNLLITQQVSNQHASTWFSSINQFVSMSPFKRRQGQHNKIDTSNSTHTTFPNNL